MQRVQLRARSNQHWLYSGLSLLVTNLDGWLTGAGTEGLYYKNTRILCREQLLIDGASVRPASVSPVGADALVAYYEAEPSENVPSRTLYATVRRRLDDGLLTEFELTNYDRTRPLSFAVFRASPFRPCRRP